MTDVALLEKVISDKGIIKKRIAEHLGLSWQGFYNKCHGKSEFTQSEIIKMCDFLSIPIDLRESIFFARKDDET